ncbi:MAG TPA: LCP family protein [Solirubrobacteraceae bacterium]|nr:LCP family protein [Solirubrobacteraceae bacterium]
MSAPEAAPTAATSGGRRGLGALKVLLALVLVVIASAVATAALGLHQLHQLTGYLNAHESVKVRTGVLAGDAGLGGPETLLLVGNDTRSEYKHYNGFVPNLANEALLVRLDSHQHWISMLSIPRELLTTIPCPSGPVQTRFNYALACGGFTTLVQTVKQVTGLRVNHVIEIDFANFEKAVDELGCVYYQVDRRYFHVNVPGGPQYQQINLQPGYQKLCGSGAEQFVSYRHGDTSIIRDARDQSFLLAVRQQYSGQLLSRISTFERIFGQLVQTDAGLKTTTGIEDLVAALVGASGLPVRQIHVHDINYSPTDPAAVACACITAPPSALLAAAHSFLDGTFTPPTRSQAVALARPARHAPQAVPALALTQTASNDLATAQTLQSHLPLRIEFPRVQLTSGSGIPVDIRGYELHDPSGASHPAFVEVFGVGLLGQYYDVEGTSWGGVPALDGATDSIRVGPTTYILTYTGAHIDQVAWRENGAVYWVHNSLTDGVSNAQMLAIAEQTVPVRGSIPVARRTLSLRPPAAPAPVPTGAASASDGSLTVPLALCAAGILALLVGLVSRRRHLRGLRGHRHDLALRIAELERAVAQAELARPVARRLVPVAPPPSVRPATRADPGAPRPRVPTRPGP